jgi:CDP-glycerol glycerophosphotransferase (TagB/SpsB family)
MAKHRIYEQYGVTTRYSFGRRESAPHPNFLYLPTLAEIYYLVALFRHSSVLINQSSTVAIESMMADVPVINVTYGQPFDWWRWYRSMVYRDFNQHYRYITNRAATNLVRSPRSLINAVNSCLSNPAILHQQRSAAVADLVTYADGNNSSRLIELVKKIA